MQNINLLVLTEDYPDESAGTKRVHHLLKYLLTYQVKIKVFSLRNWAQSEKKEGVYEGIEYKMIGADLKFKLKYIHKIISYYFKTFYLISKYKKKKCKNIIYKYESLNIENFIFIIFARILGYKIIIDIVEDYSLFTDNVKFASKFKFRTVKWLERIGVVFSNAIIVISNYLKNRYEKMQAKNLTLITITALPNINFKPKTSFNNPLSVAYAGSFGDKDGVGTIIEGFLKFHKKIPSSKLYLIGKGIEQSKYKENYKNHDNIVFTGSLPDKEYYSLLQQVDILCMCRTNSAFANAGFPFKLGEYLATGNPVIASKVSDVEFYLNSEDAFLIDSSNPQNIMVALLSIFGNCQKSLLVGKNGKLKCEKHFSVAKNGEILYKLLFKL